MIASNRKGYQDVKKSFESLRLGGYLKRMRLAGRGAADKLDLVAVGVVDIHRTAGEHGVLAAARRVASRDQRIVLRVEILLGQFQRHVVQLVARRPGHD